ncbi:hypothetical protein [Leuconostoc palmae]|uniref:hypothetical protein n=1 Tax=Leuconostoc palmae TaxID=501487 RepID=UPI001C7D1A47|nr:hypothetical protein [Leuconostoc palmae]
MKLILKKDYCIQIAIILFIAIVLPWILNIVSLNDVWKIIVIYLLLNSIYALYLGFETRKKGYSPFILLGLPIIFAIFTTFFFELVSSSYGYYLALLYLTLSLFTFFGDTSDDPDENLIPIESGFQDLDSIDHENVSLASKQ